MVTEIVTKDKKKKKLPIKNVITASKVQTVSCFKTYTRDLKTNYEIKMPPKLALFKRLAPRYRLAYR